MTEWIDESGFEFGMPEGRYFRFEDLDTYDEVKSDTLKDVDFVWVEGGEDGHEVVWLLEVKNVRGPDAEEFEVDKWTDRLVQELTDGFIMVSSVWSGAWWGSELLDELDHHDVSFPSTIRDTRIAVAFALEGGALDPFQASTLGDILRDRLKGRVRVFQPRDVARIIYDRSTAVQSPAQFSILASQRYAVPLPSLESSP